MGAIRRPSGGGMAALLVAGLGAFVIGLMTILAEWSARMEDSLSWWDPVGSLAGKTAMGVIVWLAGWVLFHAVYRDREVDFDRGMTWVWILLGIGLLGTFPPASSQVRLIPAYLMLGDARC